MYIEYCDDLGVVSEAVDEYGIMFRFGLAYFNEKKIPIANVIAITEEA